MYEIKNELIRGWLWSNWESDFVFTKK